MKITKNKTIRIMAVDYEDACIQIENIPYTDLYDGDTVVFTLPNGVKGKFVFQAFWEGGLIK